MLNVVQLFTLPVPCFSVFTTRAMDFAKNSTQDNHSSLDCVFYLRLVRDLAIFCGLSGLDARPSADANHSQVGEERQLEQRYVHMCVLCCGR